MSTHPLFLLAIATGALLCIGTGAYVQTRIAAAQVAVHEPPRAASVVAQPLPAGQMPNVRVNGALLGGDELAQLARSGVQVASGDYWYDPRSGVWGRRGGPASGVLPAGLPVRAALPSDASGGNTGVFINGRELHAYDVAFLRTLGPVWPGRYWLDGHGNVGIEGQPAAFANLLVLMRGNGSASGSNYWSNGDSHFGSDGGFIYFQSKDASGNYSSVTVGQ